MEGPKRRAITAERCSAPLAGRPTWPALNLPANRKSPATRGAKGHRALLVDGEPPHREIFSPPTAFTNTSGVSRPASRPLRPSPGPSIACPLPTDKTETQTPQSKMLQAEHPPPEANPLSLEGRGRSLSRVPRGSEGDPPPPYPYIPPVYLSPSPLKALRVEDVEDVEDAPGRAPGRAPVA